MSDCRGIRSESPGSGRLRPRQRRVSGSSGFRAFLAGVVVFLGGASFAPPAGASEDQWELNKGNCETYLTDPDRADVPALRECVTLWETYKDVSTLGPEDRRRFAAGISKLYHLGDEADRSISSHALQRLRLEPLPREKVVREKRGEGSGTTRGEGGAATGGVPGRTFPETSAADQKRSAKLTRDGVGALRKKRYKVAADLLEQAMEADPNNVEAIYHCAHAHVGMKDYPAALLLLDDLRKRGTPEARRYLEEAATSRDFLGLRRHPDFKRATGYAEILLLNGAGAEGKPHVERLRRDLTAFGLKPAFVGTDKHPRARPLVYYREGFEDVARRVKEILNNDRTRLKPIDFNTNIDRYSFDLIVVFGMPHRTALKEMPKASGGGGAKDAGGGEGASDPLKALQEAGAKTKEIQQAIPEPPQAPSF